MKTKFVLVTLLLICVMGMAAQKAVRPAPSATIDSLGTLGARVFYQLTPAEHGDNFLFKNGSGATKVPAVVNFNYFGRRDDQGRLVYGVTIFRPGFLGGTFTKDEVPFDSSRTPGTIDLFKEGDVYN